MWRGGWIWGAVLDGLERGGSELAGGAGEAEVRVAAAARAVQRGRGGGGGGGDRRALRVVLCIKWPLNLCLCETKHEKGNNMVIKHLAQVMALCLRSVDVDVTNDVVKFVQLFILGDNM